MSHKRRDIDLSFSELIDVLYPILQSIELATEVLGDELWLYVNDSNWLSAVLKPTMDDRSENGALISATEYSIILTVPYPNGTMLSIVHNLVQRLNNTVYSWSTGRLEPSLEESSNIASFSKVQTLVESIHAFNEKAKMKGFSSYIEAYNFANGEVNKIEQWEDVAGVFAVVSIHIEQELAVTRTAFLVKLDIENKEDMPIQYGNLTIIITHSSTVNKPHICLLR